MVLFFLCSSSLSLFSSESALFVSGLLGFCIEQCIVSLVEVVWAAVGEVPQDEWMCVPEVVGDDVGRSGCDVRV